MADSPTLKFQGVPEFAGKGEVVLNEIEELRQFLLNGTMLRDVG
jgi:hypothetical protein